MKKTQEFVTFKDLPAINRILHQGDQVNIVPTKHGVRVYQIKRREISLSVDQSTDH